MAEQLTSPVTSAEHSKAVVQLLVMIHCLLLPPLFCVWLVFGPNCFVVHYLVMHNKTIRAKVMHNETIRTKHKPTLSFLVLQSSHWGKESWLLFGIIA